MVRIYHNAYGEHFGFLVVGQKVQNELLLGVIDLDEVGIHSLLLLAVQRDFDVFHTNYDES